MHEQRMRRRCFGTGVYPVHNFDVSHADCTQT